MNQVLKFSKEPRYQDGKWIVEQRSYACFWTASPGHDGDAVEAQHLTGGGMSMKAHDFWVLPSLHSVHMKQHGGWATFIMRFVEGRMPVRPRVVIMDLLKCYALVSYLLWKTGSRTHYELVRRIVG